MGGKVKFGVLANRNNVWYYLAYEPRQMASDTFSVLHSAFQRVDRIAFQSGQGVRLLIEKAGEP